MSTLRRLSSLVFPRPSRLLTEVNSNALMTEWAKGHVAEHLFEHRFEMYGHLNREVLRGEAIDYLEFGVFEGQSLFKWTELNAHADSRFYGFDTFEGLPEDWDGVRETKPKDFFDAGGRCPETDDKRVAFVAGLFQDTLRQFLAGFEARGRIVVHNDSDLYTATLFCLTTLDPILVPGSVLIFDEFFSSSHEFQAFMDYTRSYYRDYTVLAAVGSGPYEQIALEMK